MRKLLLLSILLATGCAHFEQWTAPANSATTDSAAAATEQSPTDIPSDDTSAIVETSEPTTLTADHTQLVSHTVPPAAKQSIASIAPESVVTPNLWPIFYQRQSWQYSRNDRIEKHLKWFKRHPEYLQRVLERSKPYLYHIMTELDKQQLPVELALLPIVESAYQPFSFSHGRAAGIWQFIPSTGKAFGLKQNWWYDGRRDVYASTKAAAQFLKQLEKQFNGDWLHALAAYNAGPAKIRREIKKNLKRNKPTDYWHLNLPRETRLYVPKLLALVEVMRTPNEYGFELPLIDAKPYFKAVDIEQQIDLSLAAKLADISMEELYKLNPGFNRWATAPKGPHRLLMPTDKVELFKTALQAQPRSKRVKWLRHKVKSGETLGHIAERYNTTTTHIKRTNNLRGNLIRVGKSLLISAPGTRGADYVYSVDQRLKKAQSQGKGIRRTHKVIHGDTLWGLAKTYNTSIVKIARWNSIVPKAPLKLGKKLVIWQNSASSTSNMEGTAHPAAIQTIRYTVKKGDSLDRIANRFNIKVADLFRWNAGLKKARYIQPGQKIRVKLDIRQQSG